MTAGVSSVQVERQYGGGLIASSLPQDNFERTLSDADARMTRPNATEARPDRSKTQSHPEERDSRAADEADADDGFAVVSGKADGLNEKTLDDDAVSETAMDERAAMMVAAEGNGAEGLARVPGSLQRRVDAEKGLAASPLLETQGGMSGAGSVVGSGNGDETQGMDFVSSVAAEEIRSSTDEPGITRLMGPGAPTIEPGGSGLNGAASSVAGVSPTDDSSGRAAATPPLPTGVALDDEVNVARVARGIRTAINQQGGTVTLRLHPPELGFIRIQLEIQNGIVRAEFSAEQSSVRNLLNQHMAQLRSALEAHGLSVDRLVAQTLNPNPSGGMFRDGSDEAPNDGRSRGWTSSGAGDQGSEKGSDEMDEPDDEETFASMLNAVG